MAEQIEIVAPPNRHNEDYLRTKRERMGHILHHQGLPLDEEMIVGNRERDRDRLDGEEGPDGDED